MVIIEKLRAIALKNLGPKGDWSFKVLARQPLETQHSIWAQFLGNWLAAAGWLRGPLSVSFHRTPALTPDMTMTRPIGYEAALPHAPPRSRDAPRHNVTISGGS